VTEIRALLLFAPVALKEIELGTCLRPELVICLKPRRVGLVYMPQSLASKFREVRTPAAETANDSQSGKSNRSTTWLE
jgi:hypothetical protein